ncbi:MAG: dihydropteroate synthase [Bryobacterales bacterium]|nr:dihydropteroate synthase [Bryobacterales bacterium]
MSAPASVRTIQCGRRTLLLHRTLIMGVVNVTPDSFSDGGLFLATECAVEHAKRLVEEGADIVDVGGESSRPGSDPVTEEEELNRVGPVVSALVKNLHVPISIDTYKPRTADRCLDLGATMVNDITGLRYADMRQVVARHDVPAVIMHMKGEPKTMQENPSYGDVVSDVKDFLSRRALAAEQSGVRQVVIDPGIGFGKTVAHNMTLLRRLSEFKELPYPVLIGVSRKSSIGQITGAPVDERLPGTLAATAIAVLNGADVVRVHDVKECRQAVQVAEAIRSA